ncbi:unnamed protein product [Sympodiomycopsis kandeliae]
MEASMASLNFNNSNDNSNEQSAAARFEKFFNTAPSPPAQHQYTQNAQYRTLGPSAVSNLPNSNPNAMTTKSIGRAGLPSQWTQAAEPLPPPHHLAYSPAPNANTFLSPHYYHAQPPSHHHGLDDPSAAAGMVGDDDDVIPTAIVVKNIPFSVKKEQLLEIIQDLAIPMPYAFNYHYDQGIFRGLAFANFRVPEEADAVVAALNGFDVAGRKLRVEYKKVLQAGEKERIEKEKAIKRMRSMQIEKDRVRRDGSDYGLPPPLPAGYNNMAPSGGSTPLPPPPSLGLDTHHLQNGGAPMNASYSASSSSLLSPTSGGGAISPRLTADALNALGGSSNVNVNAARGATSPPTTAAAPSVSDRPSGKKEELDLNDAQTLEIYSRVLLFKDDRMRDELAFSRNLSPMERRTVHLVAQKLGLYHYSVGESDERHVIVTKHEVHSSGGRPPLRSQASTIGRNPSGMGSASRLRVKKSAPDMKRVRDDYQQVIPPLPTSSLHVPSGGHRAVSMGRKSNSQLRDQYSSATISGPPSSSAKRGGATQLQSLFASPFEPESSSPSSPSSSSSTTNVSRQPRGPPSTGTSSFRSRVRPQEEEEQQHPQEVYRGVDAQSHEPLEI